MNGGVRYIYGYASKESRMLITESSLRNVIREAIIIEGLENSREAIAQAIGPEGQAKAAKIVQQSSDAMEIYAALKGMGTDEDAVWAVLNRRSDSIPQLNQEYKSLLMYLEQQSKGFGAKVEKYGMEFLKNSAIFALAGALIFGIGTAVIWGGVAGVTFGGAATGLAGALGGLTGVGVGIGAGIKTSAFATIAQMVVDAISPGMGSGDLVGWLEDDGMDDAVKFVVDRLQGERPPRGALAMA